MSRAFVFVIIGLLSASGIAASPASDADVPSVIWNQPIQHPTDSNACAPASGAVTSRGIAVGPDQNPVFVGDIAGTSTTVLVAKYDRRNGARVWCSSFQVRAAGAGGEGFAVAFAQAGGVAIDSTGTIFIAGHGASTRFPPEPPSGPGPATPLPLTRYFVTQCSSSGVCASAVTFIDPPIAGSHTDTIGGIAVGPDGNPVLTGVAAFPSASPRSSTFQLLTVKVSGAAFALLGYARSDSNPLRATSSEGVAVDSSNNILVTGSEASTSRYDSLLSRTPQWTARVAGTGIAVTASTRAIGHRDGHDDRRHDGDRGADDAVAVAAAAPAGAMGRRAFAITVLDGATGDMVWTADYDAGFDNIPHQIAVDQAGNILIAADSSGTVRRPAAAFQRGVLMSVNRTGQVNWAVAIPANILDDRTAHSFAGVAVASDGAPVVSDASRESLDRGAGVTPRIIQFDFHEHRQVREGRDEDDDDDDDDRPARGALAWDQSSFDSVTGFLVCVDAQSPPSCQDIGKPAGRSIPSTTPGSLTYQIALARITSLTTGRHTLSVIAYNGGVNGPASAALAVDIDHRKNRDR